MSKSQIPQLVLDRDEAFALFDSLFGMALASASDEFGWETMRAALAKCPDKARNLMMAWALVRVIDRSATHDAPEGKQ